MKKTFILMLLISTNLFAQNISKSIESLSNSDLDLLRRSIASDKSNIPIIDNDEGVLEKVDIIASDSPIKKKEDNFYFGYDYFKNDISFLDNLPVPNNYILGPGDEILISMWGETNSREKFTISNEGLIFYDKIGTINLSGKNLKEAESLLVDKLSEVYSTLGNKISNTELKLELSKLKSINVYFSGEINNQGINVIHPFSNVFTALVQSGGIKQTGTLRNIEIIRNGSTKFNVDLYDFFIGESSNALNIKLLDGDIVHVPPANNRIEVDGEVNRRGFYEVKSGDSLEKLFKFTAGRSQAASTYAFIKIIEPLDNRLSDDLAMSSMNINVSESSELDLQRIVYLRVQKVGFVDSTVRIFGRVKSPGEYSAVNENLKSLLDLAGGFNDPIYSQTIDRSKIIVLRQDFERFDSKEYILNYENSSQFKIEANDLIFVYENVNYKNNASYEMEGEIYRPGMYPYRKGLKVKDAIDLANGLTPNADIDNFVVTYNVTTLDEKGNELLENRILRSVNYQTEVLPGSKFKFLRKANVIFVEGNVYSPGLISVNSPVSLRDAIEIAGGYKPNTVKKDVYIESRDGTIRKGGRLTRVIPGDKVFVPVDSNPQEFDITRFIADLSSTFANIAAIMVIVNNN